MTTIKQTDRDAAAIWNEYLVLDSPNLAQAFARHREQADAEGYRRGLRDGSTDWQPIETAPKDATHVVVGGKGWAGEAWYDAEQSDWYELNNHWTDSWGGPIYPTRWMPLPTPPEDTNHD